METPASVKLEVAPRVVPPFQERLHASALRTGAGVSAPEQLSLEEAVMLGAVDGEFFAHNWFPKTVRQGSPAFANSVWELIDNPVNRYCNIQIFRGGAKTTRARVATARRIAYGVAHTILYIGKSEGHAIRSIAWLKGAIERNKAFAESFNLRPGKKWSEIEAEIYHGIDEYPIWIMGMGISGSVRGVNRDDFRPDLIVVDDVIDEENSATPEQREKIENLLLGAVKESLAPASETPDAKLIMLQTPLNKEDPSTKCLQDPQWANLVVSCWTPETADLPLEQQESSWAERYPSAVLREEKRAYIARNKLSLWMREKECKLVSPETSDFRAGWLQYYTETPKCAFTILAIDPVPPPSPKQIAQGFKDKDYEAFVVIGCNAGKFYLLDYSQHRGHDPSWTVAEFRRLCVRYWPRIVAVESIAYQRTLAWILRKAMERDARYFAIKEIEGDRRKKRDRIIDSLNGVTSEGKFFVHSSHAEFITQYTEYPDVSHDDLLDAAAIAVKEAMLWNGEEDSGNFGDPLSEKDIPDLPESFRGAP